MKLKLLILGKYKESHWQEADAEYMKRLSPYAKIDVVELKEEPFRDGDVVDVIKEKEAEKLLKHIAPNDVVIAMHEVGKQFDSPAFSAWLEELSSRGDQLTFVFGGPLGLHESILKRADYQLSLSSLTFPHQMARVVLLEQLYRAVTISKGKKYHY